MKLVGSRRIGLVLQARLALSLEGNGRGRMESLFEETPLMRYPHDTHPRRAIAPMGVWAWCGSRFGESLGRI